MSDPFRRIFLDMLELVLKKQPSRDTQLELLQLATPGFEEGTLSNRAETKKLFRTLLTRVHPDKHPKEIGRATRLCQDVKIFYEKCGLASPEPKRKKQRTSGSPTSIAFPLEFSSANKWPHIFDFIIAKAKIDIPLSQSGVRSCLVAYQCLNARGGIAHGKRLKMWFHREKAIEKAKHYKSAKEVFRSYGGAKELCGVEEIKAEIMSRGPVVSTSFAPNEAFLEHNATMRHDKELLIVGWIQKNTGEVWIVHPSSRSAIPSVSSFRHVSVGQFGIDDCCVAPKNSLENRTWERGPYLDIEITGVHWGWRTFWPSMIHSIPSISSVEPLLKEIGKLNMTALQGPSVCTRDKNKKAHSRRGVLRSIEWVGNKWEVTVDFTV